MKEMFPHSVFVLLAVGDLETLRQRMLDRESESTQDLEWSVDMAAWEQRQWHDFDYVVANEDGDIEKTVDNLAKIVEVTRMKVG